jgi:alkylation response protein AidB-like acyl-CoA dehydrogenase
VNEKELRKFGMRVISLLELIQKALGKDKESVEAMELPADWPATQAILRAVAEDLMISASVDEATRLLRRDPKAALTAVLVARNLTPEIARKVIRRAASKTSADFSTLPCLPLATFLIELCDCLEKSGPN